jgi:hypothetical protein
MPIFLGGSMATIDTDALESILTGVAAQQEQRNQFSFDCIICLTIKFKVYKS